MFNDQLRLKLDKLNKSQLRSGTQLNSDLNMSVMREQIIPECVSS